MQDIDESHSRLQGIFNITLTPFDRDGAISRTGFAENIERVISFGFDGILVGGTYGEFATMNPAERALLLRLASDVVRGRVPVVMGTAHSDVKIVRELSALASELGGVPMVTPPFVSEVSEDQIWHFFREIAELSKTGVVIYNAPGIGVTLSAAMIEKLTEIKRIVALKQGDLTVTTLDILANRVGSRIKLFCASDLGFLGALAAGFDGLSSTNSGALPELILESYRAFERGEIKTAATLHRLWYPFRELLRKFGQPQTTKAAMNARGFQGGSVRAPLRDLTPNECAEVAKTLSAIAANPAARLRGLAA